MSEIQTVFDVNPQSFQEDVIERSRQVPIVLLFWADQVAPSVQTRDILAQLTARFQGKVMLGLVDVARDQTLAQHLRVQGLPSLRVVRDGQLVEQLEGPQSEAALQALMEQLTLSPTDMLKEQLDTLLAQGEFEAATQMLQQAINEEPNNQGFRVELADVLLRNGQPEDARTVLAGIAEETEGRERPATRLALMEEAATLDDAGTLQARVDANPEDLDARYQLAVVLAADGDHQGALDQALDILQQDRSFKEDLGRITMLRIFTLLGKGSELATAYRRRMFNFMH